MTSSPQIAEKPKTPPVLYHGTAANYLDSFIKTKPHLSTYRHLRRKAFCTSRSKLEAARFALRSTPANDPTKPGIILEFDSSKLNQTEWADAQDRSLFDEQEVAVFDVKKLKLTAVHALTDEGWQRTPLEI